MALPNRECADAHGSGMQYKYLRAQFEYNNMKRSNWYENTVFYEIYVPSFCDSNGDGTGDLKGVISRIPYLKRLGIGGIWLTPFYPSPRVDNGYDISDYRNVDPVFGTLADFDMLLRRAHQAGIRVILDMVLNHTSDRHPWFRESRRSPHNPYREYYLWEREIPCNWESFFEGSAWEYDEAAGMYYYHAFSRNQVCLNWSSPKVRRECADILRFWLDRGVDGFRLDVINFLKTDRRAFGKDNPMEKGETRHVYDKNQKGIYEAIKEIAGVVHAYPEKYLLGEIGEEDLCLINSYVGEGLLDSAFQFNLGSMERLDVAYMAEQMRRMEAEGTYPTLFFSSHDMRRHYNRLCGKDRVKAELLAVFLLTAKGIPFLYQGEEIPMEDVSVECPGDLRDIQGRYGYEKKLAEGEREETAFLYARERSRDYSRGMVDWEREKNGDSLVGAYTKLLEIRKRHLSLRRGAYSGIWQRDGLLYYQRVWEGERIGVYLCFGEGGLKVPYTDALYEVKDGNGRTRGILRYEQAPWQGAETELCWEGRV